MNHDEQAEAQREKYANRRRVMRRAIKRANKRTEIAEQRAVLAMILLKSVADEMTKYDKAQTSAPASIVWSWLNRVAAAHNTLPGGAA